MRIEKYDSIKYKKGVKIIDIQDKYEYLSNHLPRSINIPYDELMNNYRNYLNKHDVYYVYCKSGKLSKRVSTVLDYLGYNVIMLEK